MGTTRLKLYNAALRLCGAARIAALTDESEGRRLLDDVWDDDGVRKILEHGYWKFALRSRRLDYDPAVVPDFGYSRGFLKDTDWVRTAAICSDEGFADPLLGYSDEAGYIFTDLDEIFVQYVSDDASFGGDLATWPGSFQEYAAAWFASQVIHRLTSDKDRLAFLFGGDSRGVRTGQLAATLKTARSNDAIQGPTKFLPSGSWTRARGITRGRGPMGDGGTSGGLIG